MFADRLGPVVNAFNMIQSYLAGPILGIFLLGMLTRRATGTGAFAGGIIGLAVVSVVAFETHISFFYYGVVGLSVTVAVGYVLGLREPERPTEQLKGLVLGLEK
jgi:SSS family solute:Na+ symporter